MTAEAEVAGEAPHLSALRARVRAALEGRLAPRRPDGRVQVMGAGEGPEAIAAGRDFLALLDEHGWAAPTWPPEYGGAGLDATEAMVLAEELDRFETPDLYPYSVALGMVGPVLLVHGTDEQRERWLAPIRRGEEIWCQMFSEPDAGSDLAGLATRAERDGDVWRVSGQKVWTSRAHYSKWGLLLARSDPEAPKHRGITAFAVDMSTPGVELRPLKQINGDEHFNEVFLDDVVVPDAHRIAEPGEGWRVAITTLMNERAGVGRRSGGLRVEQLVELAREEGAAADRVARQGVARAVVDLEVLRYTAERARAASLRGATPGPEGSGGKLRMSAMLKEVADLAMGLRGVEGVTEVDDWQTLFLTAPSMSIRGGTDEIQRNIVGERVLGLPAEPREDKNMPFSAARRTQR